MKTLMCKNERKNRFRKMATSILLLLFLPAPLFFAGCQKDDKPVGNLKISIGMDQQVLAKQAGAASVVFNEGYVIVREVVFDADKDDGATVSFTEEKITTIDMVTGNANPPFTMTIPPGVYTSVSLGIEIQDETDKPSVVAIGTYTSPAGVRTPIRFEFNSGEVFEASSDDVSVTIQHDTPVTAKISFDPHDWFSVITSTQLDNAVRTNGVIIISETRNSAIFYLVADRLDELTDADFR